MGELTQSKYAEMEPFFTQLKNHTQLSDRQAEIYTLTKCNYQNDEIGEFFDISTETVNSHMSSAVQIANHWDSSIPIHFHQTTTNRMIPVYWEEKTTIQTPYENSLGHQTEQLVYGSLRTDWVNQPYRMTSYSTILQLTGDVHYDNSQIFSQNGVQFIPVEFTESLADYYPTLVSDSNTSQTLSDSFETIRNADVFSALLNMSPEPPKQFVKTALKTWSQPITLDFITALDESIKHVVIQQLPQLTSAADDTNQYIGTLSTMPYSVTKPLFDTNGWLSIVGTIGTPKQTFITTITTQLEQSLPDETEVYEFTFANYTAQRNFEHYTYHNRMGQTKQNAQEIETVLETFLTDTLDALKNQPNKPKLVILQETHLPLNKYPEKTRQLINEIVQNDKYKLITSTQKYNDYVAIHTDNPEALTDATHILFEQDGRLPEFVRTYLPTEAEYIPHDATDDEAIYYSPTDDNLLFTFTLPN